MAIGANYKGNGICDFSVWGPLLEKVELKLYPHIGDSKEDVVLQMEKDPFGYWKTTATNILPGTRYMFILNGEKERPDISSHYQPDGVHKASAVIDHNEFIWDDANFRPKDIAQYIIYELHVGTFTNEGTFLAIVDELDYLLDLGINAIEIMPVSQFPGNRNWGYDGVYLYGVQNSYGGPKGFKTLVNECHKRGISVILDVVYNHLGPEGNYLWDYGPYFTSKYNTPWGDAINFDGEHAEGVRHFFIQNALFWFEKYHIDALRLDAVHAIIDLSATHILQEIKGCTEEFSQITGKPHFLIAESDLNDSRIIDHQSIGGYGMDSQWCDDFHHAVHTFLTGELDGYYMDYGNLSHLAKSMKEGYVLTGEYSKFRKRKHGNSTLNNTAKQFVVCTQNHDQVGNRMLGERLEKLVELAPLKCAAGLLLLSPYVPMLFMGQEYAEFAPFLYFVSHSDPELIKGVEEGRKKEFKEFMAKGTPPNPQAEESFIVSKLNKKLKETPKGTHIYNLYKALIELRKEIPAIKNLNRNNMDVVSFENKKVLTLRRWHTQSNMSESHIFCIFNLSEKNVIIETLPNMPKASTWVKIIDSNESRFGGTNTSGKDIYKEQSGNYNIDAYSFALYKRI